VWCCEQNYIIILLARNLALLAREAPENTTPIDHDPRKNPCATILTMLRPVHADVTRFAQPMSHSSVEYYPLHARALPPWGGTWAILGVRDRCAPRRGSCEFGGILGAWRLLWMVLRCVYKRVKLFMCVYYGPPPHHYYTGLLTGQNYQRAHGRESIRGMSTWQNCISMVVEWKLITQRPIGTTENPRKDGLRRLEWYRQLLVLPSQSIQAGPGIKVPSVSLLSIRPDCK